MNNRIDNWFEIFGIKVTIHHYQNGYIIIRSDQPDIYYLKNDGKPFQTREAAKKELAYFRHRIITEKMEILRKITQYEER